VNRSRFIPLLLGLSLLVPVAAAAGLTKATSQSSTQETQSRTQETVITVWDWTSNPNQFGYGTAQKAIDQAFMKRYPNVKINHVQAGGGSTDIYPAKLQTALRAGKGPDVFMSFNETQYRQFQLPLYPLLTKDQRTNVLYLDQAEGQDPGVHGMPFSAYSYYWQYNKALFRKAGLNPTAPPLTFGQLLNACRRLASADIVPITNGFKEGYMPQWFVDYGFADQLFTAKQRAAFFKSGKFNFKHPNRVKGWNYLLRMRGAGCFGEVDEALARVAEDGRTTFASGRGAMIYDCCRDVAAGSDQLGKNLGLFRMPRVPDSAYKEPFMDSGIAAYLSINRKTKSCQAAWRYVAFNVSPEAQVLLWNKGRVVPNHRKIKPNVPKPIYKNYVKWLTSPANHTGIGSLSSESNAYEYKQANEVIAGRKSLDDFLSELQAIEDKSTPPTAGKRPPAVPCK
jgi:multiple sugar transport system substrate-binding protein